MITFLINELIRAIRVLIAYIKNDEETINRLTYSYEECEQIALSDYGCSKELFAQYYKEVRQMNPNALPYDALDFCAWEHNNS